MFHLKMLLIEYIVGYLSSCNRLKLQLFSKYTKFTVFVQTISENIARKINNLINYINIYFHFLFVFTNVTLITVLKIKHSFYTNK